MRGPKKDEALADLHALLVQGLRTALRGGTNDLESSVEDFAQDSLVKILDNLDSFRGECRFTIRAQKITVRTAFAETRRRRWRDVWLEEVLLRHEESGSTLDDPEEAATQAMIMAQFRRFVDEELTERQRSALMAALGGMTLEAVADRMSTNRNAGAP